ncbi:electron transfer flavoprotein beta subunit [Saccharopolyspora antimicrobica]|uniref:Electron transfer flavoprotein small subunit n=1 Tax=Saccharopolyspora antimicrobica TaxID=455193 RepID=A0A1I4W4T2_9PSEU|nr:mycofactocin-associated electron transfer flavoprotein beta subunit [Saccharopolyspora antimicrobica]RKT87081.1 electron transfer flavoprotein beta subunit [Saccharopolyspora antimicrobica]SFN08059.1 electron transfer flavoprotein beta subunit [Saccharopolyspora antimicrobica]
MQIVAALSWSWQRIEVDPLIGSLTTDHRGPNAAELAALEHALRLAEELDGHVVAMTVGPPEADEVLRTALAAGAHEAIRVECDTAPDARWLASNGAETARAITTALRTTPDLVLCGDRSSDGATGTTPAFIAARLGAAQALGVVKLETEGRTVLAHRRLDGGRREVLRLPTPAVISVEGGIRLRRASLPAVLAAQRAPIPSVPFDTRRGPTVSARPRRPRPRELPPPTAATAHHRILELTGALVERTPPAIVGPLPAPEAADVLLAYLHRHGYLETGPVARETVERS